MPEILHRCVEEVMGKGHDQQSAHAICRAAMGLAEDGTEDAKPPDIPDSEMRTRVLSEMTKREFGSYPVVKKRVPLCEAVGEYVNGEQEGALTLARFRKMVENFQKHPRQVPVYLIVGDPNPEHPTDLDARLADGWIEGLSIDGRFLMGDMKVNGAAAVAVIRDGVRGASIGSIQGKAYNGEPIGEVLEHVVLTNSPFVKGMNIAARIASGARVAHHFTALKEPQMAEKPEPKKPDPKPDGDSASLVEKLEAAEIRLQETARQIRDLTASNENLTEELKARQQNQETELLLKENRKQARRIEAMRVRELVALGQSRGQFRRDEVLGFEGGDNRSDEITLAWFKNSIFEGDMKLLEFALRTREKRTLGRSFHSGRPEEEPAAAYTAEEQEQIRKLGRDPELLEKTRGAKNFTDYKRLKQAAGKE